MKKEKNQNIYFNNEFLEDFLRKQNMTKKQFAKRCEISISTLNKLLSGKVENLRMDTMVKLLKFLKVPSIILFGF